MLTLFQLRCPEHKLNCWWTIYNEEIGNFVTWAHLAEHNVKLPEYMKEFLNKDNDYPIIVKRRRDAKTIVDAVHRAIDELEQKYADPYQCRLPVLDIDSDILDIDNSAA